MQLIAAQILEASRVRRCPEEGAEVLDGADVAFLCPRGELADRHILDHAPAQRTEPPPSKCVMLAAGGFGYTLYRIAVTLAIMVFIVLATIAYGFFPLSAVMIIML